MLATHTLDTYRTSPVDAGLGQRSASSYAADIRRYTDWAANRFANDTEGLTAWVAEMRATKSGAYTRRCLVAAKSYLRATEQPLGALESYRRPPVAAPRPHPLPGGATDARRMLDAVDGHARRAIALGVFAGLRVHETVSVARENIVGSKLVVKGKGEKLRAIPISTALRAELASAPTSSLLVPVGNSTARRYITNAAHAAGVAGQSGIVGDVSSHDLRATFATEAYKRSGHDILLVSKLMGHSNIRETLIYIGLDEDDMTAAVDF